MMSKFAYILVLFSLAVGLLMAFFGGLPESPFNSAVTDLIAFLQSDSVAQGLSWLAWFFPVTSFVHWIPAFINALIAFFTLRATLFVLSLHG